jgi:hypothetical protein
VMLADAMESIQWRQWPAMELGKPQSPSLFVHDVFCGIEFVR